MRRRSLPVEESLVVSKGLDPEEVVRRDGARCAAWLVRRDRVKFRRAGAVTYNIVVEARTPAWFLVAMECLRRRGGWSVVVREQHGQRSYHVEWLGKLASGGRREVRSWSRN